MSRTRRSAVSLITLIEDTYGCARNSPQPWMSAVDSTVHPRPVRERGAGDRHTVPARRIFTRRGPDLTTACLVAREWQTSVFIVPPAPPTARSASRPRALLLRGAAWLTAGLRTSWSRAGRSFPSATAAATPSAEVLDLRGYLLLPSLVEPHAHLGRASPRLASALRAFAARGLGPGWRLTLDCPRRARRPGPGCPRYLAWDDGDPSARRHRGRGWAASVRLCSACELV